MSGNQVDKGVPMPTDRRGGRGGSRYPWPEMEVGDSFLADRNLGAQQAACHYGKRHNMRFTSRREGDWIRIWRIA